MITGIVKSSLQTQMAKIRALEHATDTMDLIRVTDELYNTLIDRSFLQKHGDLAFVLDTTPEELLESDWREYLEEESLAVIPWRNI